MNASHFFHQTKATSLWLKSSHLTITLATKIIALSELQKLDELVCACVGGVVTVHEKPPWIVFAAVSS